MMLMLMMLMMALLLERGRDARSRQACVWRTPVFSRAPCFGPLLSSGGVCRADWPVFLASGQRQRRARSLPRDSGAGSCAQLRCQGPPLGSAVLALARGTCPEAQAPREPGGRKLPAGSRVTRAAGAGRATAHTPAGGRPRAAASSWLSTLMGTRRPLAQALPLPPGTGHG